MFIVSPAFMTSEYRSRAAQNTSRLRTYLFFSAQYLMPYNIQAKFVCVKASTHRCVRVCVRVHVRVRVAYDIMMFFFFLIFDAPGNRLIQIIVIGDETAPSLSTIKHSVSKNTRHTCHIHNIIRIIIHR